ncbi:heme-binding protein [Deinococcus oregonensis]|uniref:Heme-binding protein n=1 Tax=Deinococcus oregonensis TaxID=1805970 RepID=A0ABV6BAL6_9DEIO
MNPLTLEVACQITTAARLHAQAAGLNATIAVVDAGGHLMTLERMDGAVLASLETAQVKARTAVLFGAPTRALPMAQPVTPALIGGVGYPVAFVPGGYPLRIGAELVGGIAVGGGTSEQDEAAVLAGLAVWERR